MWVVGTQRAKPLTSTSGSWFRQRLLEISPDLGPPGVAYFEVLVPAAGGEPDLVVPALLFTPGALLVVEFRSLPWYRRGELRVELTGPWTVDGMDSGLGDEVDRNPGERVTRMVFALRDHLRRHGLADLPVRGLVCVAGPGLRVRQPRSVRRLGHYAVCVADSAAIAKAVARQAGGRGVWDAEDVREVLRSLHLHFDMPQDHQLAPDDFDGRGRDDVRAVTETRSEPAEGGGPAEKPDRGEPDPVEEAEKDLPLAGLRRFVRPELLVVPAILIPAIVAIAFIVWLVSGVTGVLSWFGSSDEDAAAPVRIGETAQVDGQQFNVIAVATNNDCGEHATDGLREFFTRNPCERLDRTVYRGEVDGAPVDVLLAEVVMPDEETARALDDELGRPDPGRLVGPRLTGEPVALANSGPDTVEFVTTATTVRHDLVVRSAHASSADPARPAPPEALARLRDAVLRSET
ncbi:hypothetical protein [Actinoalloteichus caeruleus]|nr:hypothetical protein [Actinoalloteichus caeruleus]